MGHTGGLSVRCCRAVVGVLVLLALVGLNPSTVGAEEIGPNSVYFTQTGHSLSHAFLDFYRQYGDVSVFGYPISEEIRETSSGLTVQYFERFVLEWHANDAGGPRVEPRALGTQLAGDQESNSAFKPVERSSDTDVVFFPSTGHMLSHGFLAFWQTHGRLEVLGSPISEEMRENAQTVQYFQNTKLEWHPEYTGTPYEVQPARLGVQAARASAIDSSSVSRDPCLPVYDTALWYDPESTPPDQVMFPSPDAPECAAKWIEVDLSRQYLRAWEYNTVVFGQYVSTGTWKHPTPTGYYSVFAKVSAQRMTNGPTAPPEDFYDLPNVPWVSYFRQGGYTIHGTYWHSNFGHPMSHGCVNMTTPGAKWIFDWVGYGTPVWIHQ
jgi:hypothetical protein